jgi:hypothetical protein
MKRQGRDWGIRKNPSTHGATDAGRKGRTGGQIKIGLDAYCGAPPNAVLQQPWLGGTLDWTDKSHQS